MTHVDRVGKADYTVYKAGSIFKGIASPDSGFTSKYDTDVTDLIDTILGEIGAGSGIERRILLKGNFDPVDAPAGNTGIIDVDVGDVAFELQGTMKLGANVDKSLFEILNNVPRIKILGGFWDGNRDNQTTAVQVRGLNAVYTTRPDYIYGTHDIVVDGARFADWSHRGIHIDALASGGSNTIRLHNFLCGQVGKTGFAVGQKPYALCLKGVADSYVGGGLTVIASSWTEVYLEQIVDVWFEKMYCANTGDSGDELCDWFVKRARRCWFSDILIDIPKSHGMRFVDGPTYPCEGNSLVGMQIACHDTMLDNTYSGIRFEDNSRNNSIMGGFIGQKHPEITDHRFKYAIEEVAASSCDYNTAIGTTCRNIGTALINKVGLNSDFAHVVGNVG